MSLPAKPGTRFRLAILFAVPVAFTVVFFILNVAAERNHIGLIQNQALSSATGKLRSISNDAEVGEHGFLLTGKEEYLATLESANAHVNTYIERLPGRSELSNPYLNRQIDQLAALVRERLNEANQVIETQRTAGFAAALDFIKSRHSERSMTQIRNIVESLQAEFGREQERNIQREHFLNRCSFLLFLGGILVMLVVLVWLYNSFLSYIQARDLAHAQLKELNADLERRIDERTKELQQFNEELQQFAYVASHDLQEPLRTITSFAQLLSARYKGRLDEDADEFISYIVTSARRMTDLINGLLAIVRLRKSGQSTTPVSFEELLKEAEISLQASIRENGVRIQTSSLPALAVDRIQFSQVFQNLISNAIKYRGPEPPRIEIQGKRDSSNWIISFADNGRGFDQQFAERIFGLFQRLHSREVEGTGMGLSIARKIVERHGGRIWAESKEGVGSTFYLSLPVSLELKSSDDMASSEVAAEAR